MTTALIGKNHRAGSIEEQDDQGSGHATARSAGRGAAEGCSEVP